MLLIPGLTYSVICVAFETALGCVVEIPLVAPPASCVCETPKELLGGLKWEGIDATKTMQYNVH